MPAPIPFEAPVTIATFLEFGHRYTATVPPSTGRSTPVMKLLSSDARNRTAEAISSGRPIRCIGVMAMNRSFIAPTFGPNWASRRGVSIGPGLTMLARMLAIDRETVQLIELVGHV